jgi:short-chain Z-isoprenyl diphosphate synthase
VKIVRRLGVATAAGAGHDTVGRSHPIEKTAEDRVRLPHPLYSLYERRLAASLPTASVPRHVGVILDGNRRWARSFGETAATGHRRGADKIAEFLGWASDLGIEVVTLWMLSTDNLSRSEAELTDLLDIISDAVRDLADSGRWRLRIVGRLDLLPARLVGELQDAAARTASSDGLQVNVAVGYGGRHEIADAVRSYLRSAAAEGATLADLAEQIDVEDIADHLYTKGQPDPELVIRTSGELRVGGFLMWQSAHSELYFCEAYWPDFRRVDFLRALRDFSQRERRIGR